MAEVWPFQPELGSVETLVTLTEVLTSRTGEQRIELRPEPRQVLSYSYIFDGTGDLDEFMDFTQLARRNAASEMLVPIWVECTELEVPVLSADTVINLDTTYADYRVGGQILIWGSQVSYTAATIQAMDDVSLTLTIPVGANYDRPIIMPLRTGFVKEGFKVTRSTTYMTMSVDFQMQDNQKLALPAPIYQQYLGSDIMTDRPVLIDTIAESIVRTAEYCDNGFGLVAIETTKNYADLGRTISFRETRGAELWQRRQWLHSLNGKQNTFWMPTFNPDLTLTATTDGTALTVRSVAPTSYYTQKHVLITLFDGTMYAAQIASAVVADPDNDTLTLVTPLGVGFDPVDVHSIMFLGLSRLDTDEIAIHHDEGDSSYMTLPIVEVPA